MGDSHKCDFELMGTELFNKEALSDVTIILGSVRLPAHSYVLYARSEYFRRSLLGCFKESQSREYEFKEGSMNAYWRVFDFMYTGAYSDKPSLELDCKDDDEFFIDVRVYALAIYFGIEVLQTYACNAFKKHKDSIWEDPFFPDLIREVYASTSIRTDQMREAILNLVCDNFEDIRMQPVFKDLIREGGDFAEDVVTKIEWETRPGMSTRRPEAVFSGSQGFGAFTRHGI